MTLILSVVEENQAFQVIDRRVSLRTKPGALAGVHDDYFNKTVVVRGIDGLCACSFTGSAYVGDVPSDHAIAECILGEPINPDITSTSYQRVPERSMWELLEDGIARLDERRRREGESETLQLECAGLQRKARTLQPFVRRYSFFGSQLIRESPLPRHPGPYPIHLTILGSGGDVLPDQELLDALSEPRESQAYFAALLAALRRAHTKVPSVGEDAMFIHMLPESLMKKGGRTDVPACLIGFNSPREEEAGLYFSPWYLGRRSVRAPAVQKRGLRQRIAAFLRTRGARGGSLLDEAVWIEVPHPRLKRPR